MAGAVLRVILFVFMLGLVIQWPVTQHLMVDLACHRLGYQEDVCSDLGKHPEAESEVHAQASTLMTWQSVFCDVPGSVASLILGAQSDKVGRKQILLLPVLGVTVLNAILLVGSLLHTTSLAALLMSSVALGVSGGIGTFMTTVTNYITDVTPEEQRTEALSKTFPFMGLGVIVGLVLSGFLTQYLGVPAVYFVDLLLMVLVLYLVVFHLKESNPTAGKAGSGPGSQPQGVVAAVWDNLTAGVKVFTSEKDGAVRLQLAVLVVSGMVGFAMMTAEGNLLLLYTKKDPFSWSPSTYSLFTAAKHTLGIVGTAAGTALFFKVMGEKSIRNDFILLQMTSASHVVINFITSAATSTAWLMLTCVIVVFASPGQSAPGSITSKLVSPDHKGAFMSLGTFLNTLAVPVTGFLLNSIYSSSLQTSPGFVFACMAAVHAAILAAVTYVITFTVKEGTKEEAKKE